ncbi:MAG: DUF1592 domain-containing protein [Planctomycetales bacterium]
MTTLESAERWQKVLNALNSNAMPPEEERQPDNKAKADFLEDLANVMVSARQKLLDQKGIKTLRRMNRREYKNTLRELLGVDIDVNELPSDTGTGSFDTISTNLFMSSDQVEQYLALGREALDEAFEREIHAATVRKQKFEAEEVVDKVRSNLQNRLELRKKYVQWSHAVDAAAEKPENKEVTARIREGLKREPAWKFYHSWKKIAGAPAPSEYGYVDAETATHEGQSALNLLPYQAYFLTQPELKTGAFLTIRDNGVNPIYYFPVGGDWPPGEYLVRIRMAATKQAAPQRRFVEFGVHATHLSTHEVQGTMESPQVIEIPFTMTKSRTGSFFIRERGTMDSNEQAHRVFAEGEKLNGIGPEFALWVDWAEVEHIPRAKQGSAPGIAALQVPLTDISERLPPETIRGALERFGKVVCRGRSQPASFFDRLVGIYEQRRSEGGTHSASLKEVLAIVLSSPRFIYLAEPPEIQEKTDLDENELAIRLSYFLWGAPPDAELIASASRAELKSPDVLARQVNRMIDDPRAGGFTKPFVHQWLGMDRLEFFRFNNVRFPAFDESTKMGARNEVYETFGYLVRKNQSLKNLLSSKFVVVNGLLARYYGIEGVHGDEFRPVTLPEGSPRGGLTGMSAILAMGSNGERTSPVERGAWILRKLLHDPPPPAPANVPQISRLDDRLLTTRERLKAHQELPQCTSCHRKIDPIGLGLENFDAVGQWRLEDTFEAADHGKKTWKIDPANAFHNGPSFRDYFELRQIIATRIDPFARGFSIALLEYALGRPYSPIDEPLITEMVERSKRNDYAIREFIQTLVQSPQFQSR